LPGYDPHRQQDVPRTCLRADALLGDVVFADREIIMNRPQMVDTLRPPEPAAQALLRVVGLSKSFPGVQALRGVDFDLRPGEIHCLIGENGAGKSTLVRILTGVHRPDEGSLEIGGSPVSFAGPTEARDAGIACIFQELSVVGGLTVAENVVLGDEPGRFGLFGRREAEARVQQLLDRIGFPELAASRLCRDLTSAEKQAVMIAKALRQNARIIIMDEPTSTLEELEVRKLFAVIARLKAEGKGIIYVSHKMREIEELGDRVTVFKDGAKVACLERGQATGEDLVRLMVGRQLSEMFPAKDRRPGEVVLDVEGIDAQGVHDVSFHVRAGEILGIGGLIGAGRTELLRAIYGADPRTAGSVRVAGEAVPAASVAAAVHAGMALVPEERRTQGIVPVMGVGDNLGFVWDEFPERRADFDSRRTAIDSTIRSLSVKTPSAEQRIATLSGGNQQKVVLGKWLLMNTRVLLLDEPTRGVDIGAKREIYRIIDDLARKGLAIVFVSSELPELLGMADRLIVLNGGRIAGELPGTASEEDVIALSMLHVVA
jgi:ABC-type sugar transport system ATPase subunit